MRINKAEKPFQLVNDARGCFLKLSPVKQLITKNHFDRVNKGLQEPFKINTLDFESTRKQVQKRALSNRISQTSVAKLKVVDTKARNELISQYRKEHGVVVPPKELQQIMRHVDLTGLELILKRRQQDLRQDLAAAKIQSWLRGSFVRQWYRKVHAIRTIAAYRIQLCWKIIWLAKIRPERLITRHIDKVLFVQRVCRGYLGRRTIIYERSEQKVNETYEYFKKVRLDMETTAIITIVYYWKRWVRRKKVKRMKALEK
jgi:hypothetical protein